MKYELWLTVNEEYLQNIRKAFLEQKEVSVPGIMDESHLIVKMDYAELSKGQYECHLILTKKN